MDSQLHMLQGVAIAELTSSAIVLRSAQDVLDLLGSFYPQHVDGVIVHEANLPPEFFQLQTRMAGDMLQKFVNYRVRIAIVGDFSKYTSKALADFIRECNRGRHIFFAATPEEALEKLVHSAG